ncbi:hypothetical protein Bca101_070492 [Brassica carinata]
MVEKSCQHYLFNFISFFSFFPIFLSFLFRSTFLCKKITVKLLVPPQLPQILAPPLSPPTAATPSWPLPQLLAPPLPHLLHRCYRNIFTAAAATLCTAMPLSLHPATVTPCTTTTTTLFTTTSIPLTSHLLSPPLHHTPPILSNLLPRGDPFFPF